MTKKVMSDILNNVFATSINIIAPLLIIPLLTAELGLLLYGEYVILSAKVALVAVISELGLGMYLAKETSLNRNNSDKISALFFIFLFIKVLLSCLSVFLLLIFSEDRGAIELLLSLAILFNLVNISPLLMGLEKYKILTQIQVGLKAIMVLFVFTLDFSRYGLEKAFAVQVFVAFCSSASLIVYFVFNNKIQLKFFNIADLNHVLKKSLPFYGSRFFVNLYQQASTFFASLFLASDAVAIYSIALQLYRIGQSIIGAVARVLFTSTVNTQNFYLLKVLTYKSILVYSLVLPIVYFYGHDILSLVFDFSVGTLFELSLILYSSLIFSILSSYWGYPALSAINKESYSHLGLIIASLTYFIAFVAVYLLNIINQTNLILCIVAADLMGMTIRLFFVFKFGLHRIK